MNELKDLKIVSFNIRCDFGQDGDNIFSRRKPAIAKRINDESPDIICFQEVLPHVGAWLKCEFPEYILLGCHRGAALDDEATSILIKKQRFDVIAADTFWLSPTPNIPGSRFDENTAGCAAMQSECPRAVTEALLFDTDCGCALRVMSLHLDHIGARVEQLRVIFDKISQMKLLPDVPLILAGDFNADATDREAPEGQEMANHPEFVCVTKGIGGTFHEYGKKCDKIDFIFLRGAREQSRLCRALEPVGECELWRDEHDGVWLSDHYPVAVRFEWSGAGKN